MVCNRSNHKMDNLSKLKFLREQELQAARNMTLSSEEETRSQQLAKIRPFLSTMANNQSSALPSSVLQNTTLLSTPPAKTGYETSSDVSESIADCKSSSNYHGGGNGLDDRRSQINQTPLAAYPKKQQPQDRFLKRKSPVQQAQVSLRGIMPTSILSEPYRPLANTKSSFGRPKEVSSKTRVFGAGQLRDHEFPPNSIRHAPHGNNLLGWSSYHPGYPRSLFSQLQTPPLSSSPAVDDPSVKSSSQLEKPEPELPALVQSLRLLSPISQPASAARTFSTSPQVEQNTADALRNSRRRLQELRENSEPLLPDPRGRRLATQQQTSSTRRDWWNVPEQGECPEPAQSQQSSIRRPWNLQLNGQSDREGHDLYRVPRAPIQVPLVLHPSSNTRLNISRPPITEDNHGIKKPATSRIDAGPEHTMPDWVQELVSDSETLSPGQDELDSTVFGSVQGEEYHINHCLNEPREQETSEHLQTENVATQLLKQKILDAQRERLAAARLQEQQILEAQGNAHLARILQEQRTVKTQREEESDMRAHLRNLAQAGILPNVPTLSPKRIPASKIFESRDRFENLSVRPFEPSVYVPNPANTQTAYQGSVQGTVRPSNNPLNTPTPSINTALWITGLPGNVTYKELLEAIRGCGRIFTCYINKPTGQHTTSAAKVAFFDQAGAVALFNQIRYGNFVLQNHRPRVDWNRHTYAPSPNGYGHSRVILITGPTEIVNKETLLEYFGKLFWYHHLEITDLGEGDMVWEFGSFHAQAQSAKLAIDREPFFAGKVKVEFLRDPCEDPPGVTGYSR